MVSKLMGNIFSTPQKTKFFLSPHWCIFFITVIAVTMAKYTQVYIWFYCSWL